MTNRIRVSCVSYFNSKPFIYGLENSEVINEITLMHDVPAICAEKLEEDEADIGLVPVAALVELEGCEIISDFCIGADGDVGSVLLVSDVPVNDIRKIILDNDSRTSVMLARILAEKLWKISPQWIEAANSKDFNIGGSTAAVVIGDKSFNLKKEHQYTYDLSAEWKRLTGLPFVFACWVSNKTLEPAFLDRFNKALAFGLSNIGEVIGLYGNQYGTEFDAADYLTNKISYTLDESKKLSLSEFTRMLTEVEQSDLMKII